MLTYQFMILPCKDDLPPAVAEPVHNIKNCKTKREHHPRQPVNPVKGSLMIHRGCSITHLEAELTITPRPFASVSLLFRKSLKNTCKNLSFLYCHQKYTWFAKTQSRTCERRDGFGSVCVWAAREEDLGEERTIRRKRMNIL